MFFLLLVVLGYIKIVMNIAQHLRDIMYYNCLLIYGLLLFSLTGSQ